MAGEVSENTAVSGVRTRPGAPLIWLHVEPAVGGGRRHATLFRADGSPVYSPPMRRLLTLVSPPTAAALLLLSAEARAGVPPPPGETVPPPTTPAPAPAPAPSGGTVGGEVSGSAGFTAPAPAPEPEPVAEPAPEPPVGGDAAGPEAGAMKGKFGVGPIRTIAGVAGINARYFIVDRFSLGLNFGFATWTYREPDPDDPMMEDYRRRNVAALGGNIEALFWARLGQPGGDLPFRADFGLGGRFGFIHAVNASDVPKLDDALELHLEIPLMIQLMIGENFAIIPEFGAAFRLVPGDREPNSDGEADSNPGLTPPAAGAGSLPGGTPGPGFSFQMGNNGNFGLFLGGGIEYYF
jgi:hypothetical protein